MSKYARFDPAVASPSPVTGWFDTDTRSYPVFPDADSLIVLTEDQWANRTTGLWAVSNGQLVTYIEPVSMAQQAINALNDALATGINVTSDSQPEINATYALDPVSTAQIFQIGLFAAQFGVFPSGGATQAYPDLHGIRHTFNVTVFTAFLRAVAPLVSTLQTQAAIMANGGTPTWPEQDAEII